MVLGSAISFFQHDFRWQPWATDRRSAPRTLNGHLASGASAGGDVGVTQRQWGDMGTAPVASAEQSAKAAAIAPPRGRSPPNGGGHDPRAPARSRSPIASGRSAARGSGNATAVNDGHGPAVFRQAQAWHWSSDVDCLTQAATFQAIRRRAHPLWYPDPQDPPPVVLHPEALRGEIREEVLRLGLGPAVRSIAHQDTGTTILIWRASITKECGPAVYQRLLSRDVYQAVGKVEQGQQRSTCWLTAPPCRCPYQYTGATVPATPMPPYLTRLAHLLQADLPPGPPLPVFNSLNITKYNAATSTLPWHADDERLFGQGQEPVHILSWSLGAPMRFEVRDRQRKALWLRVTLRNGDAMLMMDQMQRHHSHQASPAQEILQQVTQRINLTWRHLRHHECGRMGQH